MVGHSTLLKALGKSPTNRALLGLTAVVWTSKKKERLKMGTSKRMLEAAKRTLQKERKKLQMASFTGARARLPFPGPPNGSCRNQGVITKVQKRGIGG